MYENGYSSYERVNVMYAKASPLDERIEMLKEMVELQIIPLPIAAMRAGMSEEEFLEKSKLNQ